MFSYIQGTLVSKNIPIIVLDVQGVGYELIVSINSYDKLPEVGTSVKLLTHFLVREDAQILYGFIQEDERSIFREVMKVSGFGAKLAMSVLSSVSPGEFARFIQERNKTALIRLPGIGAKSADRLIVELGDKLDVYTELASLPSTSTHNQAQSDAESALIGLGYKQTQVRKALEHIEENQDISAIIRQALQALSKR